MSLPARHLAPDAPSERRSPAPPLSRRRPATPARTTAARPQTPTPPHPRRRARRGPHPAFILFSAVIVGSLLVGIVVLNAILAQQAIAISAHQERVARLSGAYQTLRKAAAEASSPWRVSAWASVHGLVDPHDPAIVLRGGRTSSPAGRDAGLDPLALSLKPVVEGG